MSNSKREGKSVQLNRLRCFFCSICEYSRHVQGQMSFPRNKLEIIVQSGKVLHCCYILVPTKQILLLTIIIENINSCQHIRGRLYSFGRFKGDQKWLNLFLRNEVINNGNVHTHNWWRFRGWEHNSCCLTFKVCSIWKKKRIWRVLTKVMLVTTEPTLCIHGGGYSNCNYACLC